MNIALPGRRPLAALLAFILLAAGLTFLAPAASAQAASNSSYAASFLKVINQKRAAADLPAFLSNESINKIAVQGATLHAKGSSAQPSTSLPEGGEGVFIKDYIFGGSSTAARFNFAKSELPNDSDWKSVFLGDYNYGAVGVYTTSSRVYVYLVAAQYDTPIFSKTATPTISGTVKVGNTITAKPGTYSPAAETYTYQWKVAGTVVGTNSATFIPRPADKGKKITVTVTAAKSGYLAGPAKTSAAKTVAIGTVKLSNLKVSGNRNVFSQLTITDITLTPSSAEQFLNGSVQWYRNGKAITGETGSVYQQVPADRGKKVTVKLTAKGTGFVTTSIMSKGVVTDYPLQASRPTPTIDDTTPTFGQVLTLNPGTWDQGTTQTYQWYAGGKAISKATKATYTVSSSVIGKAITVKVTSKKSKFATATTTSAATTAVVPATFTTAGQTGVTGTFATGQTLTAAVTGTSPAASYSYQWYRGDSTTKIAGATKSTLKLTQTYVNEGAVNVVVTVKKTGYTTVVLPKYLFGAL